MKEMYFPVLHGAQNELLALEDAAVDIRTSKKIIPVLIPLGKESDVRRLTRLLKRYNRTDQPFCLVMNPHCCDGVASEAVIRSQLIDEVLRENSVYLPTLVAGRTTRQANLAEFFQRFPERAVCVFHEDEIADANALELLATTGTVRYNLFAQPGTGRTYRLSFPERTRVQIEDPFEKRNNADYPADEAFTDSHMGYAGDGLAGFGDYLIVGRKLAKGFAPRAVTLHLTYRSPTGAVRIRHFVSDRVQTTEDTAGKYLEAVRKLVAWAEANADLVAFSEAVPRFRASRDEEHFPGLGTAKRLSIQHHLQLIAGLLSGTL
jgi:hypothetical protein